MRRPQRVAVARVRKATYIRAIFRVPGFAAHLLVHVTANHATTFPRPLCPTRICSRTTYNERGGTLPGFPTLIGHLPAE